MKKLFSLMLAVTLAVGAAFACAAQKDETDRFAVNAALLEWFKTSDEPCTLFLLQSDALYDMQPDARFTVYSYAQDKEQLTELANGGAAQWTRSAFTDANGKAHVVWSLSDMPACAYYLQFAAGAFTDAAGDPAPELCAQYTASVRTNISDHPSAMLQKLQTVKTDARFVEGEEILFPQDPLVPSAFFRTLVQTETDEFSVTPASDDYNNLIVPAAAGHVRYTLLFCGQPVGQPETVYALSRADYAELYKKDRALSVLKGLAFIPCLPLFILYGSIYTGAIGTAASLFIPPLLPLIPLISIGTSVIGFENGARLWWQTVRDLIGGKA